MRDDDTDFMREVLQRIATGPTMSKELSRDEARRAMRALLEGTADPVQAGIFLIALRMKRESEEELIGVLDAIHDGVAPLEVDVDILTSLVDPYDGSLRGTPVAAFLPALLAACGLPTLSHGVRAMGPKFGATHALVLEAAGATEAYATHHPGVPSPETVVRFLLFDERFPRSLLFSFREVDMCLVGLINDLAMARRGRSLELIQEGLAELTRADGRQLGESAQFLTMLEETAWDVGRALHADCFAATHLARNAPDAQIQSQSQN